MARAVGRRFLAGRAFAASDEERSALGRNLEKAAALVPLAYTCDGVVLRSDHVMLVTRNKVLGRGLLTPL